jgi:hypothetical protein
MIEDSMKVFLESKNESTEDSVQFDLERLLAELMENFNTLKGYNVVTKSSYQTMWKNPVLTELSVTNSKGNTIRISLNGSVTFSGPRSLVNADTSRDMISAVWAFVQKSVMSHKCNNWWEAFKVDDLQNRNRDRPWYQ